MNMYKIITTMKKITYIILFTLFLSSCNIYRKFERPEMSVADSYRNLDTTSVVDTAPFCIYISTSRADIRLTYIVQLLFLFDIFKGNRKH